MILWISYSERKNEPVRECCAPGPRKPGPGSWESFECGKCERPPTQYACSDKPVPCFGIPTAEEAQSFLQNCGDESDEFIENYCTVEKTFYDYMMAEGIVEIFLA